MSDSGRHIRILGYKVKDKVTGFEGVVTHVGFDLYGCIQVIVHPQHDAKDSDSKWFDINRLNVSEEAVMECPDFNYSQSKAAISSGHKGGFSKSMPS